MENLENITRLNKFVAHCGVCTRREAEFLIKAGEIKINENVETNPFYVLKDGDIVTHKGKILKIEEKKIYLLFNKPKDMPLSKSENSTKPGILDLLKKKTDSTLIPIDSLDVSSAGLTVFTNDLEMVEKFRDGRRKIKKIFHVELDKQISPEDIQKIREGIEVDGVKIKVQGIDYIRDLGKDALGIEMHEGNDKSLYGCFRQLGYGVTKLDRTYFGGLTKKDLKRGWNRMLTHHEVIFLKHF